MRKWIMLGIELLVSIALIVIVMQLADFNKVIAELLRIDLRYFALALLAYFCINAIMAYRLKIIFRQIGENLAWRRILQANFAGMLASDFTPARSGYFATAFSISANENVPLQKAIAAILAPQMFDFMSKVLGGTIALIYIMGRLNPEADALPKMAAAIIAVVGMISVGLLLLFSPRFMRMLKIIEMLPFGSRAYKFISEMQGHAVEIKPVIPMIISLLCITWVLKGFEWWMLSIALGLNFPFEFHPFFLYFFLQPLVTILQFIPTPTLAGTGLSELGAAGVLLLFGVPFEKGVAFGLLTRGIMISLDLIGINEARRIVRRNLDKLL